jgi:predicted PurR-regulated permease PerM
MKPMVDSARARAGTLVLILGALIAAALLPFLAGLLGAAVLYVVCAPAFRRLARVVPGRGAALLVVAAASVAVLLPGTWLVNALVQQAPETLRGLADDELLARLASIRIGSVEIGAQIAAAGDAVATWLTARTFAVFGSVTQGMLNLVIALFGLYYLLLENESLWRAVAVRLPFSARGAEVLRRRFHSVTEAMLLGTALTAVLQGLVVGVGFRLVGLPHSLFWGIVTGFASVLPVLGSALVWLPGVVVLLAQGRPGAALALGAIGGLVASNVDNLARPFVYERVSHIHPMVTLVGAFAGVRLIGLLGVLIGPLAISYFFELLRIFHDEYEVSVVPGATPSSLAESPRTVVAGG